MSIIKTVDMKTVKQSAIETAQSRIDAAISSGDDHLLEVRLVELASIQDDSIDLWEYLRPPPPSPMRPRT